jgi:hypothetical protein
MNCRCISVNSQIEHDFPHNLINPYAILIEDINQDNVGPFFFGNAKTEVSNVSCSLPDLSLLKN